MAPFTDLIVCITIYYKIIISHLFLVFKYWTDVILDFHEFFFPYFSPPQSKSWLSLYIWFISTNANTCSSLSSTSSSTVNWCNILGFANQESMQVYVVSFSVLIYLSHSTCRRNGFRERKPLLILLSPIFFFF